MKSHNFLRTIAVAIATHAGETLPRSRREWGRAMSAEVECIENDVDAMLWSLGCVFASYLERMRIMAKSNLNVARWLLGLEIVACLGPLAVLWIVTLYVLATTPAWPTNVVVPTALATMGPVALVLAVLFVMRRAVPSGVFALLACGFAVLGVLQITGVLTAWFAFDWRVWMLESIVPALACAHLARIQAIAPAVRA